MEMRVYDTLGPPSMPASAWVNQYTTKAPFPSSYMNPNSTGLNYVPPAPYNFVNDAMSLDSLLIANGADTVRSSSGWFERFLWLGHWYSINQSISFIELKIREADTSSPGTKYK